MRAFRLAEARGVMPFQSIPGTDARYALIGFDDRGIQRRHDPDGGVFSQSIGARIQQEQPSHVFLFSHGWKGDVPGAVDSYNRWIGAMLALGDDRAALGSAFKPLFIGLHWPSQPWGEEQ